MREDTKSHLSELGAPQLLLRLWQLLDHRRRRQFLVVSLAMAASAVAEVLTLGVVVPFIGALVEPDRIMQYRPVSVFADLINATRPEALVVPLAVLFIAGSFLAALVRILVVWATTHLAVAIGADLSSRAYHRTLYQPYSVHVGRNTSEVVSVVVHKVEAIVGLMLIPLQTAFGSILTITAITFVLVMIDPVVALVAFLTIGGCYLLITKTLSSYLTMNSHQIARDQSNVIRIIQEGVGGIREILINGTQEVFLNQFRDSDRPMRRRQGSNTVIRQVPRVVMEGIAMLVIAVLAVALSRRSGGIAGGLPVLGALALGGQRLLPLFQQCYGAATTVLGHRSHLVEALEVLEQPMPVIDDQPTPSPIVLDSVLKCNHLRFRYSEEGPWVIDDLDMSIYRGTSVGLVGSSGCGKSTLLDLLAGLLCPTEGEILVDGKELDVRNLRTWQSSLAYVPQHVFLADDSFARNIAFGIKAEEIDMPRVMEAARRAMIADLIEAESAGYATDVGERGARLSGGQRQRIGIARALYRAASFLILDEATSALDIQTESAIARSIADLENEVTLIIVTHRLSTLRDCDAIIEMRNGQIIGQGTYEYLQATSETFKDIVISGGAKR